MRPTHPPAPRIGLAIVLALCAACAALAQDATDATDAEQTQDAARGPDTGSDWIDARLLDMDDYAARYRDAFVDEIVRYREAPRAVVEEALADGALAPGEVYYACALAQAGGMACRSVLDAWRENADDGWSGVAERLDIGPAAAIHRRIRGDITESYVRWARPIGSAAPPR